MKTELKLEVKNKDMAKFRSSGDLTKPRDLLKAYWVVIKEPGFWPDVPTLPRNPAPIPVPGYTRVPYAEP